MANGFNAETGSSSKKPVWQNLLILKCVAVVVVVTGLGLIAAAMLRPNAREDVLTGEDARVVIFVTQDSRPIVKYEGKGSWMGGTAPVDSERYLYKCELEVGPKGKPDGSYVWVDAKIQLDDGDGVEVNGTIQASIPIRLVLVGMSMDGWEKRELGTEISIASGERREVSLKGRIVEWVEFT